MEIKTYLLTSDNDMLEHPQGGWCRVSEVRDEIDRLTAVNLDLNSRRDELQGEVNEIAGEIGRLKDEVISLQQMNERHNDASFKPDWAGYRQH